MQNKGKKKILSVLLSFSMFLGIIETYAPMTVYADKVELNHDMSITVDVQDGIRNSLDELTEEDGTLVYDLYKIADLVESGETFKYVVCDEYKAMEEEINKASSAYQKEDKCDFYELAQTGLKMTAGAEGSFVNANEMATYQGLTIGEKTDIEPGLYLVIVRSSKENKTVVKNVTVNNSNVNNNSGLKNGLATYSLLGSNYYTCSPQIICAPTKVDEDSMIVESNLDEGDWVYDQTCYLKMSMEPAVGAIEIEKELVGYFADAENATFIFQVDTYYPTENDLYSSEVYAIQFTGVGTKKIRVEGLPIGSTVKVSEIYSGVNYTASVASTDTIDLLVSQDEVPVASFVNTYNKHTFGGGGVTNHFSYGVVEGTGSWSWEMLPDNTTTLNGLSMRLLQLILQKTGKSEH